MSSASSIPNATTDHTGAAPAPPAPSLSATAQGLLLSAGVSAALAYVTGVLLLPGARGRLGQVGVEIAERMTSVITLTTYLLCALLLAHGGVQVFRAQRFTVLSALTLLMATLGSMLVAPGLMRRLSVPFAMGASAACCVGFALGSIRLLLSRERLTRISAAVVVLLTLTGAARALAFAAMRASHHALAGGLGAASVLLGLFALLLAYVRMLGQARRLGKLLLTAACALSLGLCAWMTLRWGSDPFNLLRHSLSAYPMPPLTSPLFFTLAAWRLVMAVVVAVCGVLLGREALPLGLLVLGGAAFDIPVVNLLSGAMLTWLCLGVDERASLAAAETADH